MKRAGRTSTGARLAALGLVVGLAGACVPATFENLTGGPDPKNDESIKTHSAEDVVQDDKLPAPRPISPISVSWVNTSKPKFRWENAFGLDSVVIELSRQRDLDSKIERQFTATGTELKVPDDLEPGIWFWRLRSRTSIPSVGKFTSPVWEVLVRGPSRNGESDVPTGALLDRNGDGLPDIAIQTLDKVDDTPTSEQLPAIIVAFGQQSGGYSLYGESVADYIDVISSSMSISAGSDLDGDGFADVVIGGIGVDPAAPTVGYPFVNAFFGSPDGRQTDHDWDDGSVAIDEIGMTLPIVDAAGDRNGDGYGDITVSLPKYAVTASGGIYGPGALTVLHRGGVDEAALAIVGGADFDHDGYSDLAVGIAPGPVTVAHGSRERSGPIVPISTGNVASAATATSLTTGDFDGDGSDDLAFLATIDGKPSVCIYLTNSPAIQPDMCWQPDGGFLPSANLVAGDVESVGQEDVLVVTPSGPFALRYDPTASPKLAAKAITTSRPVGATITMVHPGRPGKAVWATVSADAKALQVFSGIEEQQTLPIGPYTVGIGPAVR